MANLLGDTVSIVRELSLDALRDEALLAPSILIVGGATAGERVARGLFGADYGPYVSLTRTVPEGEDLRFDLVVLLWEGDGADAFRVALAQALARGWAVRTLSLTTVPAPAEAEGAGLLAAPAEADWEALRARLTGAVEEGRLLALGRYMPPMRAAAAQELIALTSRANAQFSAFSSLPALLPVVGNVFGVGADMLVLTKNQVLMIYKLAALFGRDIDDRRQVYMEMAPVIGAGFLWRTIARSLVGLVPSILGVVPKVAIAYSGTYIVGRAALYYYQEGRVPTRDDIDAFRRQAFGLLDRWRAPADERAPIEATFVERAPGAPPEPAPRDDATVH